MTDEELTVLVREALAAEIGGPPAGMRRRVLDSIPGRPPRRPRPAWVAPAAGVLLAALLVAVLLAGRGLMSGGPTPVPGAKPSPSPSPSPAAPRAARDPINPPACPSAAPLASPVVAVLETGGVSSLLRLESADGCQVYSGPVSAGSFASGGDRLFWLDQGNRLHSIDSSRRVTDLGGISPGMAVSGLAASPDGARVAWSASQSPGGTGPLTSRVYVAGAADVGRPQVVDSASEPNRALYVTAWTAAGLFAVHGPVGIGGYIPIASPVPGPVDRIDPALGSVVPIPYDPSCVFADLAADGTSACVSPSGGSGARFLRITTAGGQTRTISLATPAFNAIGDAFFAPGPAASDLTVAGALIHSESEHFTTEVVSVLDGSSRSAPDGLAPAGAPWQWLPGGALLTWRPWHGVGGPSGVFILGPGGATPVLEGRPDAAGDFLVPVGVLEPPS